MREMTLAGAVNEVNDAMLFGLTVPSRRRRTLSAFIAGRQGLSGAYCGLFAPVEGELSEGYVLPTGERIASRGGSLHVLGEESLRALILLAPATKSGRSAIDRASKTMGRRLIESESSHAGRIGGRGTYCCMRCSVALWRALSVGAFDEAPARISAGLEVLRSRRDGKGGWRGFPFNYTLSALLETQIDEAMTELRYARPSAERRLERLGDENGGLVTARRRRLMELAIQAGH